MSFPATIDDFTPKVDNTDDVMAADVNELQTAIESLEAKIGVDDSAVATSIDYLLKNAASIDPGHLHTGSSVELLEIGDATYDDLQDFVNSVQSSGFISGFTLSNSREVLELDVAAGSGMIKITDSAIGVTKFFDFAGVQNVTLTADNINYIYVDYNAGTPQIVATTDRSTIELNRHIILGRVYKNGTTLHILNSGVCVCNIIRKDHERLVERDGFDYISGAILSEVGSLNLSLTAGVWYMGLNRITTDALDTSVADTFEYKHYGTASWITDNASATALDCTHYNDGDDVLGSLGVNNYGVQWVYITTDSKMWIIYGTENGTLTTAEAATPPASIPTYIETMGELVAKIIVRQSGSIISILATQAETYSASAVSNHNELGGLQGGAANDYYHLTVAQHTIATQAASTTLSGYLLTADWDTFNNKQAALTFGIADTNSLRVNDADAADNDYCKLTATGIEGRSYAEVKTDLSLNLVENTALSTWTGTSNIATLGTIATGVWEATDVAVAHGGTGASTASVAASNLGLGTEDTVKFTALEIGGTVSAYNSLKVIGRWGGALSIATAFYAADKTVNANETNYGKAGFFDTTACDIGSGYTDSGYRIALHVDGYIEDADFEGTLTDQYGLWARSGINSGTGTITNSYGAKINPMCSTGTITNLYGLYIADTTSGGTVTNEWAMYIANDALSYFAGTVSALAYVDRTKGYSGDALKELKKVKNKGKSIDHSTLPEFARTKVKSKDKNNNTIEEDGRDLGAMISVLTVAVQQLTNRLEILEAK